LSNLKDELARLTKEANEITKIMTKAKGCTTNILKNIK
jgi:hypothetical protein